MRARKIKALKTSKNGKIQLLNGNFQELCEKSPGTTVVDWLSKRDVTSRPVLVLS